MGWDGYQEGVQCQGQPTAPPRQDSGRPGSAGITVFQEPTRALPIDPPFVLSTHHRLSLSSPSSIMSTAPSTSTVHSDFVSVFNAALETYKRKTKNDLSSHPLLPRLQSCNSAEAVITALREQVPLSSKSQNGDDRLTKWVSPTVNVLYAFSATVGQVLG
jgi:hypothetical protein